MKNDEDDYTLFSQESVLVAYNSNSLQIENFRSKEQKTHQFTGFIESLMTSADESKIIIFTDKRELCIICLKTLEKLHLIVVEIGITFAFFLNRKGNIVCVLENDSLRVYSPDLSELTFKTTHTCDTYPETFFSGRYVLCRKSTSDLQIWDMNTSEIYFQMSFQKSSSAYPVVTQDMRFLGVTLDNNNYEIYAIPSGERVFRKTQNANVLSFTKN